MQVLKQNVKCKFQKVTRRRPTIYVISFKKRLDSFFQKIFLIAYFSQFDDVWKKDESIISYS